ncbi:MAG: FG-GAP-like repeat-containing protein [Planctomycetia bacterium]|nr:FG-GAP-like repeat-containing protein [Planctomycetia bacterium]
MSHSLQRTRASKAQLSAKQLRVETLEDRITPDATYHVLANTSGGFSQNWSNTSLITTNDDWSGVPSIIGYRGDVDPTVNDADPQTVLSPLTEVVDVLANHTNTALSTGGVAEFEITNPTIAFQGDSTADAPFILLHLNTIERQNIKIAYTLRDIDGSADNAAQQVALQYRVGDSGDFTNVSAGYVADVTTGPSEATKTTNVSVTLPTAVNNQSKIQVRIITTNAGGTDEWVGVDDISVTSDLAVAGTPTVSDATTDEDTQTTDGLVITASSTDNNATSHYKITNITNGTLFKADGMEEIARGTFITKAEGAAGLKFTPDPNFFGTASFQIQAATAATDVRLGGDVITATITVNPVNDGPVLRVAGTIFYQAGDPATVIDPDAPVTDDSADLDTGTLTVEFTANGTADDRLAIRNQGTGAGQIGVSGSDVTFGGTSIGSFTGGVGTTPLVVTLNANATPDAAQALVRNITFQNTSQTPSQTVRTVRFTLTDGEGGTSNQPTANVALMDPVFINEILFEPPGDDQVNEYVELRGVPGATIPTGTYLVGVNGNPGSDLTNPGQVHSIFDLSGLTFGSNGYLVLLQNDTPYSADSGSNVVTGTTSGFEGVAGFSNKFNNTLQHESVSFMLIQTGTTPAIDDDIDADDDGAPDGSIYSGWTILDSVGVTSGDSSGFRSYAALTFMSTHGSDSTATGKIVSVGFTAGYLGRIAERTGSGPSDWVASRFFFGTAPNFTLDDSATTPADFANLPVDHIGSINFGNAAPKNTVPGTQSVNEDTNLVFSSANGNAITIADADAESNAVQVTLTATNGTLTLSTTANLTVTGDGTATVTITGALADINTALAGLIFAPTSNFFGTANLTVSTNDLGSTGPGGSQSDEDTIDITVNALADTPTVTSATTDEDTQTTSGLVISRSSADGSEVTHFQITNIQNGTLFLGDGTTPINEGDFISFAQGNAGLKFTPNSDLNDATTVFFGFDVQASLNATDGLGGSVVTASVSVSAVNDEPSVTLANTTVAVNQDSGAFSQSNFATFSPGGGTDEASQTPTYTLTNTNTALFGSQPAINAAGTLTFTPAPGAFGTAVVTVNVTDSGSGIAPNDNTGTPQEFTITVNQLPVAAPPVEPPAPAEPVVVVGVQFIVIGSDAGVPAFIRLLDAETGAVVRELSPFDGFAGGVQAALGDVNADGTEDIIAATASLLGHVKVFDGATGALIQSFMPFSANPSGLSLAAGDVNKDGAADIVVAPETGPAHVMVFSGLGGSVLQSFFAFDGFLGGVRVSAGDVNGDGRADLAVVAGPGGNGHIKVFDGATGAPVTSFLGFVGFQGAINIAMGDVTGDGSTEVITTALNPTFGNHVKAFSPQTGGFVLSFFAPTASLTPTASFLRTPQSAIPSTEGARVAAGDMTGDRIADLFLAHPAGGSTELILLDGKTSQALDNLLAFDSSFAFGVFVDVE